MFRLTNKNALVTGATGGIGAEIALSLVKQGARVVISGTREEKLKELQAQIGEDKAKILTCNLSDFSQVEALFEKNLLVVKLIFWFAMPE